MATKKYTLTKSFSYYGESFQYKFVKGLMDNPMEFQEIAPYLKPTDFSVPGVSIMVKEMLQFNEKRNRVPSWKELEYIIKDSLKTEDDVRQAKDAMQTVKESDDDAISSVLEIGINFVKQEEALRILGSSSDAIKNKGFSTDIIGDILDRLRSIETKTRTDYSTPLTLWNKMVNEGVDERITTGIPELDKQMNGGLARTTTGLLIAGTGVGKTTLMSNMAVMGAILGNNVLYIYFEDKDTDITRKAYSVITNIPTTAFFKGSEYLNDAVDAVKNVMKENPDIREAFNSRLKHMRLPNGETTIEELKTKVRSLERKEDWKPDIIYIDYIGCLQSSSDKKMAIDKEYATLERCMKRLDTFAQEENCAIWVAQQTNRDGAKMDGKNDRMANIQGSYRLVQTASAVLYLERNREDQNDYNRANLYLDKCRGGQLKEWHNIYLNNGTCQIDMSETIVTFDPDSEFNLG